VLADIEYELTLLSRHYARSQRWAGQTLDRSGYLLLSRLELEHPLSLKELATAFRLDLSTIHRQVAVLLRQGLVEYTLDPEGGPAREIQPTRSGFDRLREDREQNRRGLERVVGTWGDRDLTHLHELLVRFNRGIEELEGRAWPRPDPAG
jgi:DNA-binding MarR family transcriptional regulator